MPSYRWSEFVSRKVRSDWRSENLRIRAVSLVVIASVLTTVAVTDPNGHTTTCSYDPGDRLVSSTTAGGVTTTYTYSRRGQQTVVTDALGHTTSVSYDAAGRVS